MNDYRDPPTQNIEDWKWHPMADVTARLDPRRELPDHVMPYAEYMQGMNDKAQRGELSLRDLVKAHTITQSSIGRGGLSHASASKYGMKLPNTGGEIRPEGAFSEWLGSPMGQRYLDAAEAGEIHPGALEDIRQKFAAFGKQNSQVDAMRYAVESMRDKVADANKAVTGSKRQYRDFASGIKGVAGAKSGFIGSLLGRGDQPTLDARQLALHSASYPTKSPGTLMNRGRGQGGEEAVDRLTARQESLGYDIPEALRPYAQHLIHHDVWDQMGGTRTTHHDLIDAMRNHAEGGKVSAPTPDQEAREAHANAIALLHVLENGMPERPAYKDGGEVEKPPRVSIADMRIALDEKATKHLPRASEELGKHEGKTLMVTQADRTKVGGGLLGGPGFSGIQHDNPDYEGKAWGVMTPGMASTIMGANRRVPEGQALWSTLLGTPEQHSSNQAVFNRLVTDFRKHAKAGLLHPELHAKINERLSALSDQEGKPFFGEGSDILDKGLADNADTFMKRRLIGDLIGGVGVGGKKARIGKYDEIMRKATDPLLMHSRTHAIGPRLFNLSGETSNRPDLHPAFPQMLHGEDYGQTYRPVPKEIMLRDYMDKFRAEKNREPGYMDLTMGYAPSQHLSEDFLTHLQKQGHAQGGSIAPTQDEMQAHVLLHRAIGGPVGASGASAPDNPDGTSSDLGFYEGGPSDGAANNPMQYRAGGGSIRPATDRHIGVDEAPAMLIKQYMPPSRDRSRTSLPIGGVDFAPNQPGEQLFAPPQAPQQGQPGQPPGVPGQPPQGPPGQGQPPAGAAPAMPPPGGPQSNILQMTPQGQAMSAMRATAPGMPKMAEGGAVADQQPEQDEPRDTVKAYKLFRVDKRYPGKLFPLFIGKNEPVDMNKWVPAEHIPTKGFAERPGWHAGDLPMATHIGEKSDNSLTAPDTRPHNQVWTEIEMPNDVDWQTEANKRGTNQHGRVIPVKAHITDQVPTGGHYRYKTNPNMTGSWLIGGAMKVNRILHDDEVKAINRSAKKADLPRREPFDTDKFGFAEGGAVADAAHPKLNYWLEQYKLTNERQAAEEKAKKEYADTFTGGLAQFLRDSAEQGRMYHGTMHSDDQMLHPADRTSNRSISDDGGYRTLKTNQQSRMTFLSPESDFANEYAAPGNKLSQFDGRQREDTDRGAMYPVHVKVRNPFDHENPVHVERLVKSLNPKNVVFENPSYRRYAPEARLTQRALMNEISTGDWDILEHPSIVNAAKTLGHDGMYMRENGVKNLGVFDPKRIKSATGNRGTYDIREADMTKAKGGPVKPVVKASLTITEMRNALADKKAKR